MPKDIQQIVGELAEIRERVRAHYPPPDAAGPRVPLADLMPLFHARDAAEGKVAAIGKVNPRPPGALNRVIQAAKRSVARSLGWFIRDQVDFNAASVRAITETLEALNEVNRGLAHLAAEQRAMLERIRPLEALPPALDAQALESEKALRHATDSLSGQIRAARQDALEAQALLDQRWQQQQTESQQALASFRQEAIEQQRMREREDIRLLRTLAEVQNAFQQRLSFLQQELRLTAERHAVAAVQDVQQASAEAIAALEARLQRTMHEEIRLLRQRVGVLLEGSADAPAVQRAAETVAPPDALFDSVRFSERFRGSADDVREKLRIYVPLFAGKGPVPDLGCGRGEFLELMAEVGTPATGVEANGELVRIVRAKGLAAEEADLFRYLEACPPESIGGILSAHVIEHMPPEALVRMLALARRALRPGGVLALETPNPSCLAIFATYFYLDPTHVRPVPSELLRYLLEEGGFHRMETWGLHPAAAEFPAVKPLPESFRQQFFEHLDYGVIAYRP